MRRVLVLSLLLAVAVAAPEAPVVLATWPPYGAVAPAGVDRITVVFDRAMRKDAHSLVRAEGGAVPGLRGGGRWLNDRTFRIEVRLEPGQRYALGFNDAKHQGFQSAQGAALAPVALRFTTAPAGVAPPVVVAANPELGSIVPAALDEILVTFSEDVRPGRMALLRMKGVAPLPYHAERRPYLKSPRVLAIPVRLSGGTTYGLWLNETDKAGFVTKAGGRPFVPCPLVFTTQAGPVGTVETGGPAGLWMWSGEGDRQVRVAFHPDGRYVYATRVDGKESATQGRWRDLGGDVEITPQGGEPVRVPYRRIGADALVLTLRGAPIQFRRQRAEPRAALTGTWAWCGEGGELRIVLGADGRFVFTAREGEAREDSRGRWRDAGSVLVIHEDGAAEPLRVPYRLAGDTLTIELEGQRFPLERQK